MEVLLGELAEDRKSLGRGTLQLDTDGDFAGLVNRAGALFGNRRTLLVPPKNISAMSPPS